MDEMFFRDFLYLFLKDIKDATIYGAVIFLVALSVYFLYNCLRFSIQKNLECWFCMKKSRVIMAHVNCWTCSHCEQYNGFDAGGDYNRPIEENFSRNGNFFCYPKYKLVYERHRLCEACNKNQGLKIQTVSQFTPSSEENFMKEVKQLKHELEDLYPLCFDCERLIQNLELDRPNYTKVIYQNEDEVFERSSTPTFRRRILSSFKTGLYLGLFSLLNLSLLRLVYLFYQNGETAFIFKKSVNTKLMSVFYREYYIFAVTGIQLNYLLLMFLSFTVSPVINWLAFSLFFSMILVDFDVNIFKLRNDLLVDCQRVLLLLYASLIVMNIIAQAIKFCYENFYIFKKLFNSSKVKILQKSLNNNSDLNYPSDVEMENLDEMNSGLENLSLKKSKFPFNLNNSSSVNGKAFWATQIHSTPDSQTFNHVGFYQTHSTLPPDSHESRKSRLLFYSSLIALLSCCVTAVYYYSPITVILSQSSSSSNNYEITFRFESI